MIEFLYLRLSLLVVLIPILFYLCPVQLKSHLLLNYNSTLSHLIPVVPTFFILKIFGLGNIFQILSSPLGPPWNVMTSWHHRFGPLYSFTLPFFRSCVSVDSPALLKALLSGGNHPKLGKDVVFTYTPFLPVLGRGIVTSSHRRGGGWGRQRGRVARCMKSGSDDGGGVLDLVPSVTLRACKILASKVEARRQEKGLGGGNDLISEFRGDNNFVADILGVTVDLNELFRHLTLDVISAVLMSLDMDAGDSYTSTATRFSNLYLPIVAESNRRVWNPFRKFYGSEVFGERVSKKVNKDSFSARVGELNQVIDDVVAKRWEEVKRFEFDGDCSGDCNNSSSPYEDVLGNIMKARVTELKKEFPNSPLPNNLSVADRSDFRDEMKTFVLAGHETTAAVMSWSAVEILRTKEGRGKMTPLESLVVDDGNRVFGASSTIASLNPSSLPDRQQLMTLDATTAILKESLRMFSVVPTVTRSVDSQNCTLVVEDRQVTLPVGTTVMIGIQAVHMNPQVWREPKVYDHGRFMPGGEHSKMNEVDKNFGFIPFIAGPRNCLGQYLSMLEASMVLSLFFKEFDCELVDEGEVEIEGGVEVEKCRIKHPFMVPVTPRDGVKVRIRRRKR